MKLLSKLLILSLCASFGVAECGFLQRFSALSRSWVPQGIAATVASYWFMKPAVVKAEHKPWYEYSRHDNGAYRLYGFKQKLNSSDRAELFLSLCKVGEFDPVLLEKGKVSCKCQQSFQAAYDGYGENPKGSPHYHDTQRLWPIIHAMRTNNEGTSCVPYYEYSSMLGHSFERHSYEKRNYASTTFDKIDNEYCLKIHRNRTHRY